MARTERPAAAYNHIHDHNHNHNRNRNLDPNPGFQETAWACKAAVDGKTSLACMPTPEADDWIWSIRFAETRGWPRPPVCSYKEVSRLNYQTRYTKRERLTKLVNGGRALEYRPMLKSGSTYFRSLLTCLQPGEWAVVKEATPMPANHSSIVLVREHTRRFVSAVSEVMRRIFASQCPGGPCSSGADDYYTEGKHDSADALARKSSWYRHALRLYSGQVGEAERNQTIRELLAAAVTDSGCFLSYYGAEHMMTQSQLMAQGSATLQARADDTSQHGFILRLEDLGRDAESLQRSSLLRIIGASHLPRDAIGSCAAQATEAEHNTRSAAEELEATGQGAELVGQGGSDEAASYSLLPTEEAMHAVLMGDDGLLISLCQVGLRVGVGVRFQVGARVGVGVKVRVGVGVGVGVGVRVRSGVRIRIRARVASASDVPPPLLPTSHLGP